MSCDRCAKQTASAGVMAASSGQTEAIFAHHEAGSGSPRCPSCQAWYNPAESCQNPNCSSGNRGAMLSKVSSGLSSDDGNDEAVLDNYLIPDGREDLLCNEFLARVYSDMATAVARTPRKVHPQ